MDDLPTPLRETMLSFLSNSDGERWKALQRGSAKADVVLPDFASLSLAAPPVIFLDVDGVLNSHASAMETDAERVDAAMLDRVRRLAESADAAIVISSDWRCQADARAYLEKRLAAVGLNAIGCTPVARGRAFARPAEILQWLASHATEHCGRFVVLDDRDLIREVGGDALGDRFVRTDPAVGFTEADLARAVEALRRPAG